MGDEPAGPARQPAPEPGKPTGPPVDAETEMQLDMWVEAKRTRDFATADSIRGQLEQRGIRPELVRPHLWEPPGSRRPGSHAMPPPSMGGMGRGGGMGSRMPIPDRMSNKKEVPKLPPGIDTSVGDWHCQACGNWNWARRKDCNQCNSAKDGLVNVKGAAAGTKRLGEGGGFKEFDEEESNQRKRRAQEERREKEERKAEKKKCDYCKRFSCIC